MIRSNLCDYGNAYTYGKGTITVTNIGTAAAPNDRNKKVIFKNCAPYTNCISEINNTQVDDARDIGVVMPMYNLIEYSDTYSKTSGSPCQFYRDEPALNNNDVLIDFPPDNNNSISFKLKQETTGET